MKVDELIALADGLKNNDLSVDLKLRWINDVEGRVHCEIKGLAPGEHLDIMTTEQEISVPMPYAKMYLSYIIAMIAFSKGEYELYSDLMMKHERDFCDYAKFCIRNR